MGFWIFMLIMELLIPVAMIGFGKVFLRSAPKTINPIFGYRTKMSMKNEETWEFAHKYFGIIWYRAGWISLLLSLVIMLLLFGQSDDTIGNAGAVLCMLQMIPLIVPIFFTERALREEFDKDGKRKK